MDAGLDQPVPKIPESAAPTASRKAVPIWVLLLLFLLLYWGMVYFDLHGGWFAAEVYAPYRSVADLERYQPPPTTGPDIRRGQQLFEQNCALCHNSDGTGKPAQGPPFVGSEWVLGSANRMIRIPQHGLAGPIQVKGQEYNLNMAAMGVAYSDDDLAAVLTYIRSSWGNKASPITAEQVKAVRTETANRSQPWTAKELEAIP